MVRLGLLTESERQLDYVLGLTNAKIMERRLQTQVFKLGLAKSVHHARCLIRQKHIDFALTSPFGGGRPGRVRRKRLAGGGGKEGGDDDGRSQGKVDVFLAVKPHEERWNVAYLLAH